MEKKTQQDITPNAPNNNNKNNTTCSLRFKSLKNYITNSISSYHRIIMMMSIWDFIVISLGKFPASWAMPVDTPNVWYAAGTRQTCTMQGFFIQFSLIVPIYNSMTALYYLLVVHFGLSNRVIATKVERWIHICPFVVAFSFAFVGLVPSGSIHVTLLNEYDVVLDECRAQGLHAELPRWRDDLYTR